jgi:hypothetical protein
MMPLEAFVARKIWLAENMRGGSDDHADAARAAIQAVREWDARHPLETPPGRDQPRAVSVADV